MARGKASVQRYEHVGDDPRGNLNGRANLTLVTGGARSAETLCVPEANSSLAEHIVDQLRVAYDGLLSAPIPDHLNKLLADLCKAEEQS
jgi:hypothetical protein